jgi:hypothetical protein
MDVLPPEILAARSADEVRDSIFNHPAEFLAAACSPVMRLWIETPRPISMSPTSPCRSSCRIPPLHRKPNQSKRQRTHPRNPEATWEKLAVEISGSCNNLGARLMRTGFLRKPI